MFYFIRITTIAQKNENVYVFIIFPLFFILALDTHCDKVCRIYMTAQSYTVSAVM